MEVRREGLLMGELRRRTLAIFSAQYLPHMGGVENFTKELSSALERMGVHAIVVTSAYGDASEHEVDTAGLEVFRLPSSQLLDGRLPVVRDGEATRALLGEVAKAKPDGVFVNTRLYGLSLMGVRFARNLGITPVVLDHGSSYIGFGVPVLDSVVHAYEKAITRKIRSYSPKFYGVSEKSAEWLRTFGIIADGVIHNAIEAEEFRKQASRRDFRAELGIGPDVLLVCFVGRIANGKGVEVVTELARRFERRGKRIHFAIAGDGPDFKALKQHAPEYASVLGRLGRPDVAALFGQSDLHILPSKSEGLPTSLLEASAEGTPSLVFDVGGAREVIPSDSYGIVLDDESTTVCEEVLDWYLDNRDVLKEQGANVRKRVEHVFSWEATARKTIEACGV